MYTFGDHNNLYLCAQEAIENWPVKTIKLIMTSHEQLFFLSVEFGATKE